MKYFLPVLFFLIFYVALKGQSIQPSGPTIFCAGGNVVLSVNPATGITGYQWIRNAVDIQGQTNSTYTVIASGNYSVRLKRSALPDTTIGPVGVTVNPKPTVTVNSLSLCTGQSTTLTANGANTYTWSPATGLSATTGQTVTATPGVTTTYIVTGTTLSGCSNTANAVVTVVPFPTVPSFTFSTDGQCANLPFAFNVQSPVAGVSYLWDFGDFTTGTGTSVSHIFNAIGNGTHTYSVNVTATVSPGCSTTSAAQNVQVKERPDAKLFEPSNFRFCGNVGSVSLNVTDVSTPPVNTNYQIIWGDGTPGYLSNIPPANEPHTYPTGIYSLIYNVTGTNGCVGTNTIGVLNISNPRIGAGIPANAAGCGPLNICFPINNFQNNHSSTLYMVDFGDGTPILNFTQPPPDSVCHTYSKTSCIATGGKFSFQIQASNGCDTSYGSFAPIRVFTKPIAAFSINSTPGCVNSTINFINTTLLGYNSSCSVSATYSWDFGDGSPLLTVFNNGPQAHVYSAPGTYTVKLIAQNTCDTSSYTLPVCIEDKPVPSFVLPALSGCKPFVLDVNNTTGVTNSCQPLVYNWSVNYTPSFCGTSPAFAFINGTNNASDNPSFDFTNSGTYTITQNVTNACGTFTTSQPIDVKQPPVASIILPPYPCGPVSITPTASVTACGTSPVTYAWTFAGGSPATSTAANPPPVTFAGIGPHAINLVVTNECGITTATQSVNVTAAPDVIVPADQTICGGKTLGPLNFSSTVGAPVYNWTNSNSAIGLPPNGTGNILSFIATNNGTIPLVSTINVTPFESASCAGIPVSFQIIVNPGPAMPAASVTYTYCRNEIASVLSATAATGNTLTWYNNSSLTGGSATPPVPSTAVAGVTLYYVTQTNSFNCTSDPTIITVTVTPGIAGNLIGIDQAICANTIPATLNPSNAISGGSGSYSYFWQSSIDGGITWANILNANNPSYPPPLLSATIQYRRIVNSSTCTDTSNVVTITVQGALANYDIAASQIICNGDTPALLTGQLPTGGGGSYTYIWESSTDNINWISTGGTSQDYQPPLLFQTTYFRRKVFASLCNTVSPVITVTVNPTPNGTISTTTQTICEYDSATINFTATAGTFPYNIQLTVTGPGGTSGLLNQIINNNGPVNITVIPANSIPGTYAVQLIKIIDANNCTNNAAPISTVTIDVKPRPVLSLSAPPTICNGTNTVLTASGAASYQWSPANSLSNSTGNSVTASPVSTTTYTVTGTSNNCSSTGSITVTVMPGTTIADAGPAQILCNVGHTTLAANNPIIGTGTWLQLSGPAATITNPSLSNTTVTGLIDGQRYIFQWTIAGLPPCPASIANDTVDVLSLITNTIKNDTIICSGQSVLLQSQNLSGGATNGLDSLYTYQWESASPGQSNWQLINGATQATLTINPAISTCYRRKVKSNNSCEIISNPVCITVNPNIVNNTIGATPLQVCVNVMPPDITGSVPTGGDNNYIYQWQTSTDSISWIDIGSNVNFQPAIYTVAGIHYFRRTVTSGNCTSVSNTITITVNPDSKALFTTTSSIGCAPFNLATVITVTPLPGSNGIYQWYANGVLFGTNSTGIFPGYTILNPADTVLIKLKTTSQFGCKADSIENEFVTVITAQAKFTKDTSFGCGPLQVNFLNVSSILNNGIQYNWDFGNGVTSTLMQPGAIIFNSSPFFSDTTYLITLKVYNGCVTTIWTDSVKIRANPKARFGVDTTFGCSPFTVSINNTSAGGPNTYYWDFGDGHKDTTYINGILNYTYHSGNVVDTFIIRLIAENQCRRDTQSIDVRVAPNPIRPLINVSSSQLFGCAPHTVIFNNNTSGATAYTWNFGDGSPIIITNNNQSIVQHTFDSTGTFTVSIDITNGCSDTTVFRQVTVLAKPVAGFTTNSAVYCVSDTVKVNNTSLNAINYQWFWGDGTSSLGLNPVHLYTQGGTYIIKLQAQQTNSSGVVCYDTMVHPIAVLTKPNVSIQSNINTINCAPFTLDVTAPGIINENVSWYFYDSTVSPSIVIAGGISAQYSFNKPGTFYVKMVAVNSAGCKDSTIAAFMVRGKAVASFTPTNLIVCTRDTTVTYNNTSTYNGTDPITYQWLVDNIPLSPLGIFTHRFTVLPTALLPRIFNISLIVSNTIGCSDTASASLQMNPVAKAQFSIANPNDCVPFKPVINNTSVYTTSYQWLLNGIPVSNAAIPDIAITKSSTLYNLTLIANNVYGCKPDTMTISFTSRIRPAASFSVSDTLGCTGVLNVITNNTTANASSYIWNWGDNTSNSVFRNSTHLYTNQGQYLITLVASDGVCTDTTQQIVKVSTPPMVDFSVDQTTACDTARIQFINLSKNVTGYLWSFGDGTTDTSVNPIKTYLPNIIPYTIKLVAISNFGCKDSTVKANLVLIKVAPAADFFISPAPVITVPNYTFNFNNLTLNSINYKYLWSLGDGTFASTRDVIRKYADTGNYLIRLIVLDTVTNCKDTSAKIARIDGFPGYLYVPNAICPGCIQSNLREFLPKGAGLKNYHLQIYTTWNELIFETTALDSKGTPTQAWDGKFKGTLVQQDVYVWRIDAKFLNGTEWLGMIYPGESKYKKVGTITVVK